MKLPNQQGITIVIFVVLIALTSVGIVSGSFFIKNNNPKLIEDLKLNLSKDTSSNTRSNEEYPDLPKTFEDKVIFVSGGFSKAEINIGVSGSDGKNLIPFTSQIPADKLVNALVSPNYSNILLIVTDKPASITDVEFMFVRDYYLSSLNGADLTQLDISKLKSETGNPKYLTIDGWSVDSKKLILTAYMDGPTVVSDKITKTDINVYEYSIGSSKVTKLFSTNSSYLGAFYYDSSKKILVYNLDLGSGDSKTFLRNLARNTEIEIKTPNMANHYSSFGSYTKGQFYGGGFKPEASLNEMRSFKIYSIENTSTPVSEVNLTDPETTYFDRDIYWSPSYNYFAIMVQFNNSGSPAKPYQEPKLNIYTRGGKLISTVELNHLFILPNGVPSHSVYQRILFSPDDKSLLIASNQDYKPGEIYWRVVDVATGLVKVPKFTDPNLGIPVAWY